MHIGYLVNQYPMVSLSFIRREIHALEAAGHTVTRFAIREWDDTLVDQIDLDEQAKTRYLTGVGALGLVAAFLGGCVTRPAATLRSLKLLMRMRRGSNRPLPYHLAWLAEACVLRQWCERAGVDHVHAHFASNPADVAMYCRELGGPTYSVTIHGPTDFDHALVQSIDEKVARCSFIAAISSFCRSQVYRWSRPADWPKVREVHCGLDAEFLRAEPTPVPQTPRLVTVGRLCAPKAQVLLVEAVARAAERGASFELVIVGDGPMRGEIEAAVARHGLGEKVRITGWAKPAEVLSEIQQARAMVMPSFAEGLPVVIMEALALCRPVVSTYIAGIPELVVPGEDGWLVPAGDLDALTDALVELGNTDTATLQRMGESGRAKVLERHDAAVEAGKLAALIEQAIASERKAAVAADAGDGAAMRRHAPQGAAS